MLLGLEGVHFHGEFGRRGDFLQEYEALAPELCPIAQVQVLGQRVMLPAAGRLDAFPAPDPRCPVEVEKPSRPVPGAVFHDEMAVQHDRLDPGQDRVAPVEIGPPGLYQANPLVTEPVHGVPEEVRRRDEVGVENRDERAARHLEPLLQCARLVSGAFLPVKVVDIDAGRPVTFDATGRETAGFVGRIVQYLYFQPVAGIVDAADGVDQPFDHVLFVVEGQLYGDHGGRIAQGFRLYTPGPVLIFVVQIHHQVPVDPVDREQEQDEEVEKYEDQREIAHTCPFLLTASRPDSLNGLPR